MSENMSNQEALSQKESKQLAWGKANLVKYRVIWIKRGGLKNKHQRIWALRGPTRLGQGTTNWTNNWLNQLGKLPSVPNFRNQNKKGWGEIKNIGKPMGKNMHVGDQMYGNP